MQETVRNLLGDKLTDSLINMLGEFRRLGYDDKEIYVNVKDLNDLSIMGLYLLATEDKDNLAFYIKKTYDKVLNNRVKKFKESIKDGNSDNYLSTLDKTEVLNLAFHMNMYDISSREYNKLSEEDKNCYNIINNYLKNVI